MHRSGEVRARARLVQWFAGLGYAFGVVLILLAFLVTEREIANRKSEEDKFRNFLESAPDAIVIVNCEGLIQFVNVQTEKLFGYARGAYRTERGDSCSSALPRFARCPSPRVLAIARTRN